MENPLIYHRFLIAVYSDISDLGKNTQLEVVIVWSGRDKWSQIDDSQKNKFQLTQRNPRDALLHVRRAVYTGQQSTWYELVQLLTTHDSGLAVENFSSPDFLHKVQREVHVSLILEIPEYTHNSVEEAEESWTVTETPTHS